MANAVLTERRDRVLLITLNRPEARNAVNGDVARGVEAALDELEGSDELRAGVLAAVGPTFSAGADLKAIASGRAGELATERGGFAGLVRRRRSKPLVAALHADTYAGGFEIAIACDLVVAGELIQVGLPEVKRSLVALGGALVELPRLVGEKLALEIALVGDPIPAARLHHAGLIARLCPADQVLAAALELAAKIAANGPLAVRASRQIVLEGRDLDGEARWALSQRIGLPVFGSADAREGAVAFVAKRPPVWQGK